MARRRQSLRGLGCLLLSLALAAGAAIWFYWRHRPALRQGWQHAWADLTGKRTKPLRAANAKFLTVEQLLALQPGAGAPATVRVEARLVGLQRDGGAVRLELSSLINPALRVNAIIPGRGAKSPLYDELREDVMLRFGAVTDTLKPPANPTTVVVTAGTAFGPGGLELRPVTDLHVE